MTQVRDIISICIHAGFHTGFFFGGICDDHVAVRRGECGRGHISVKRKFYCFLEDSLANSPTIFISISNVVS